ncbi:tRNA(fMet)-specific endonuclease VapC [Escherichia coli]|nr:tRNA(fMet)-specific endonuclease VapC [Escherichia coli]
MNKIYMLDTNICSFIMREQPEALLKHRSSRCCAVTVSWSRPSPTREMRFGATGPKARHATCNWLTRSVRGLDAVLPWDRAAVDATTEIKVALRLAGTPIGPNDTAIAGHAIAACAILVTNNNERV